MNMRSFPIFEGCRQKLTRSCRHFGRGLFCARFNLNINVFYSREFNHQERDLLVDVVLVFVCALQSPDVLSAVVGRVTDDDVASGRTDDNLEMQHIDVDKCLDARRNCGKHHDTLTMVCSLAVSPRVKSTIIRRLDVSLDTETK